MSEYQRVLSLIRDEPWAILPDKLEAMEQALLARIASGPMTDEEILAAMGASPAGKRRYDVEDGVAIIPVFGVISKRANFFTRASGGTSTDALLRDVRMAAEDDSVRAILLDIDSPGGSVFGPMTVAETLLALREVKPIEAVANEGAYSAAYWIAAGAEKIHVSRAGEVGSVGVIGTFRDYSKANEKAGVSTTYLRAGKYKARYQPDEAMTKETRELLQAKIDQYYALFVESVAKLRGMEASKVAATEAATYVGQAAIDVGLADAIGTYDEVLLGLKERAKAGGKVSFLVSKKGAAMADPTNPVTGNEGNGQATQPTAPAPVPTPAPAPAPAAAVDSKAIQEAATAAERTRVKEIRELYRTAALDRPNLLAEMIDNGDDLATAKDKIFKAVLADRQPISQGNGDVPPKADPDASYRAEYEAHKEIYQASGHTVEQYIASRKIDAAGGVIPLGQIKSALDR